MKSQNPSFKNIFHTDLLFIIIFIILNVLFLKLVFQPYQSLNGYLEENTLFDILVCGWVIYALIPFVYTYIKTRSFIKSFLSLIRFQVLIMLTASFFAVLAGVYFIILYNTSLLSDPIATGLLIAVVVCLLILIGVVLLYRVLLAKSLTTKGRKILFLLIPLYLLLVVLSFLAVVYSTAFGTSPQTSSLAPNATIQQSTQNTHHMPSYAIPAG